MSIVPQPYELLASDAEREQVAEALRAHAAAGRLDPDEHEQRLERVYAARIRADLLPPVADLPAPTAPAPPRARAVGRRRPVPHLPPLVLIAVMLVAIWAVTGADYFWPVWPIGAIAFSSLKHRGRHRLRATA
jgi:ferric-dicitrate binding protein FerR (iron transport regulator)